MQINKYKTVYKQKQGQKSHNNLNRNRKNLQQISTSKFMIKALKKLEIEGMYNIIKAICDKPRTNIIQNGEKLKPFPISQE
jgi:hypothetical protein